MMSKKEIAYEIGKRIKNLRQSSGMTQEELSIKLGHSSRSYISRIESGEREIGQSEIVVLAKIFDVSPEYILCGKEIPSKNYKNETPSDMSYILNSDEKRLVDSYRGFNDEGKEKLLDTISDMEQLDRYKKYDAYYQAARSDENTEPQIIKGAKEKFEKLNKIPPVTDKKDF